MSNKFLPVAAAMTAAWASFCPSALASTPSLSGKYALTEIDNCIDNNLTIVLQITGYMDFSNGIAALKGYSISGNPLTLSVISSSGTYSNTWTTITINGVTYEVFYGSVSNGVAQYVSFVGIKDTCGVQGWLARR